MSKDSNIVQFPQKTEEQKQLDLLNKQFVEIETQGSEIEDQTRRVNDFVRKQRELTDLNHDGHE